MKKIHVIPKFMDTKPYRDCDFAHEKTFSIKRKLRIVRYRRKRIFSINHCNQFFAYLEKQIASIPWDNPEPIVKELDL